MLTRNLYIIAFVGFAVVTAEAFTMFLDYLFTGIGLHPMFAIPVVFAAVVLAGYCFREALDAHFNTKAFRSAYKDMDAAARRACKAIELNSELRSEYIANRAMSQRKR